MATLKSIPDLLTEASTNVPDNTTQQVSPQDLRELTENTAFSSYNKITDTSIVGLKEYDTGISYPSGQWVSYLGDIYQANTTTTPGAFTPAEWTVFSGGSGGNFADTNLTVTANRNHDVAGFTLTYDNGIISNTNMQFGVNGNFNVTSNGALGNDIAQFISSSANPVLIASNANEAVVIGNTAPTASAVLDVNSTTKGMLVPRMTTAERDLISTPAESLLIYNTTTDQFEFRNSAAAWEGLGSDNFATTDLSLTGARTHNLSTFEAKLENGQVTIEGKDTLSSSKALLVTDGDTVPSELLTVFNDGKIAIGKTTASFGLDVEHSTPGGGVVLNIVNSSTSTNSSSGMRLRSPSGANNGYISVAQNTMTSSNFALNNAFNFQAGSGTDMTFALSSHLNSFSFFSNGLSESDKILELSADSANAITYLDFGSTNSTTSYYNQSRIQSQLTTTTAGSEDSEMTFQTSNAGTLTSQMIIKANGVINMPNLPTSSAGLVAGDLWNNSGVINIV